MLTTLIWKPYRHQTKDEMNKTSIGISAINIQMESDFVPESESESVAGSLFATLYFYE